MLAPFLVPHAHYRVFQGHPAADALHGARHDHFPCSLSPATVENAATDLHLREFAQLEVHVKALELQAAHHTNPRARGDAVAGALAECFLFYARLFTVESFPCPDFLAAVCTKLAEHFATSENVMVQSAILRVFQQASAHVAQVNDACKMVSHVSSLVTTSTNVWTRTLTLHLLATLSSHLVLDTTVHEQILKRLEAEDQSERCAAMDVTRALLRLACGSFRQHVFLLSMKQPTTLCSLLPAAVSSPSEAHDAWTACAQVYDQAADDTRAVTSLRAMTTLTAAFPAVLLPRHGQLVHHVLDHDPRPLACNFVLLATQELVERVGLAEEEQLADVMEGICSRVRACGTQRGRMRLTFSALLLLEKWSCDHIVGPEATALLQQVQALLRVTTDTRVGKAYTCVMRHLARHKRAGFESTLRASSVDELLRLLHPRARVAAKTTWDHALNALASLCQDEDQRYKDYVPQRLVELLSISTETLDPTTSKRRRSAVLGMLGAQLEAPHVNMIQKELPMLLNELSCTDGTDAAHVRALAATFFLWTREMQLSAMDQRTSDLVAAFERQLLNADKYASLAERYEMAKLAMLRGRYKLALQLLDDLVARTESTCFGGWLNALQKLCDAESRIETDQWVQLDSLHAFASVSLHLHAARTSSFRFELQLHFVSLRLEWLQLLQSAQQLAGEAAFTNAVGHATGREGHVITKLHVLARKFEHLRTLLLGASQHDLDALRVHARACGVLAVAMEGLLLLQSPRSMQFPTEWTSDCQGTRWHVRMLAILSEDVREKLHRIARLSPSRQPGVAARVLQQLIAALCGLPLVLPTLFFRSRLPTRRRLAASAQFLTHTEHAAFTSKPRARAQLGVSLGTDFTTILNGAVAVPARAKVYWRNRLEALEAQLFVCLAADVTAVSALITTSSRWTLDDAGAQDKRLIQHYARVKVRLGAWWAQGGSSSARTEDDDDRKLLYVPFMTPVHVPASDLTVKGSFMLMAKLGLVDTHGENWPLAATGCRRGFIVY
ncbi:hypothetical protein PsorP6_011885 [Peronosclerospora sorghi]|uniref:Uncharacterized protein n=1 Tax=Peronosclerospora sorghi TaxID=230839 RepID=A0ACC0WLF0_9STRA|nr:hypothetical protein PsorP6_011885 [Peronosclerospora sorghi]